MMIGAPRNFYSQAIEQVLGEDQFNFPENISDPPYVFVGDKDMQDLRHVVVPRRPENSLSPNWRCEGNCENLLSYDIHRS